ncbi:MAG: copper homeostasis protein CutC [Bacteroidales bacterium]|nr:copper homeostasis protein CutC [Bacteroidales bacterium]
MIKQLELAAFNLKSALTGIEAEVDRIEFCADFLSGGITPNIQEYKQLRKRASIPIYVMIRPRGGNFTYSPSELSEMKKSIEVFKNHGADGFVFGVLNDKLLIDKEINCQLVELCTPFPTTFHRAFDRTPNPEIALQDCIDCGFRNILTSGHRSTAIDGLEMLNNLKKLSLNRINFVVGGGVRSANLSELKNGFDGDYFHTSAILGDDEYADIEELKSMIQILRT